MPVDTDKLADLIDGIDLPALVERETKVKPKRAGAGYQCTCPLHGGDNPTAFHLSQNGDGSRWLWHCFTRCHAGGDALGFIRRHRNMGFLDAVRWLCDYTRTPFDSLGLTEQAIAEHHERERRRNVLDLAAQWYREQFAAHPPAVDYVRGRGFSDDAIALAGFGYSSGKGLDKWLKQQNADIGLARQIGLLRTDGRDFTANANGDAISPAGWLVYVHRVAGRVDYLSARALNPDPELKDKSRNLPGEKKIYRADVRGDSGLVIAEGQLDAESWRQLGLSAWALCGTTLAEADAAAIRGRKKVFLALDNDGVGSARTDEVSRMIGPLVMITPHLPNGRKDANEWLQKDTPKPGLARDLLKASKPYLDRFIFNSTDVAPYDLEKRIDEIAALVALLPDTMQGRYIKRAAAALEIPPMDIRRRVKQSGPTDAVYSLSEIRNGSLHFRGDALCNFAAEITHQLTMDDGQNSPTVRYTIAARLADSKPLPAVEIDAEEFETVNRWVPRHWGADGILYVPPSQAYLVARAMKEISRTNGLKRETVYTFTGWTTIAGAPAFLTAGGAIVPDGFSSEVRVELGHNRLTYYKLPAPPADAGELRTAVKHSLDFLSLAPLRVTAPLWCAMYGAPLMEIASLNAVIWIYGPTQSRKSTLAMLALTHWGEQFVKGREYYAPIDWVSTVTNIEGAMFATKNVPIVVDDFAPQFTGIGESRDMHKKAHLVVRSVGNRSARGRSNADLTERAQRPPRGIVLATAELPLTGQSIVGRMIYVPVERGDVVLVDGQTGPLDRAQALAGQGGGMYARAMAGYVHWLARHRAEVFERARANHERANQYARTVFPSTQSRLMDYYADLITYGRTALEFAVAAGAIDQKAALRLGNEELPAALVDLLANQSARVAGQSPVVRLFEAVADMVMSRRAYLAPRIGSAPTPPLNSVLIGWYGHEDRQQVIYLRLGTCLQVARDYWMRTGEGFDTTTDALQREIFQAGLLSRRDPEHYAVSIWIPSEGKNSRVLLIDNSKLPDVAGVDLWPGQPEEDDPAPLLNDE